MYRYLLIPIVVLVLVSCSDDEDPSPTGPDNAHSLMPLAVGNYWIWEREHYKNDQVTWSAADTMTIVDTFIDQSDITWYNAEGDGPVGSYRNTVRGL